MKWKRRLGGYLACDTPFGTLCIELDVRYPKPFYLSTPTTHKHYSTKAAAKRAAKRYIQKRIDEVCNFAIDSEMEIPK